MAPIVAECSRGYLKDLNTSIEDVLLGAIPGLPKVHLHNPVLAVEVGSDFIKMHGTDGYWAALGTDRVTGQPIAPIYWQPLQVAPIPWDRCDLFDAHMTITDVDKVANALLYQGYLLSPYRPSALGNRQPFNFGIVAPGETMQTECIVEGNAATTFDVRVRFLQLMPQVIEREVSGPATFAWPPLSGAIEVSTTRYADEMLKLRVRIVNLSNDPTHNMVATHTILRVADGQFLSMIDPPAI